MMKAVNSQPMVQFYRDDLRAGKRNLVERGLRCSIW